MILASSKILDHIGNTAPPGAFFDYRDILNFESRAIANTANHFSREEIGKKGIKGLVNPLIEAVTGGSACIMTKAAGSKGEPKFMCYSEWLDKTQEAVSERNTANDDLEFTIERTFRSANVRLRTSKDLSPMNISIKKWQIPVDQQLAA
ncbi:hypothetical protein QFC21_007351 [Naganishia friedmannii]|uniref:Uncharacterized protein n=1 Tax=Naganishia friedmannii TaxID=89922 RepID=A0ACC2UW45_9TREE|nr:hypothetical protein QFC21_007351 [Naganishia friedmannii]